jgi:hypothetical protein
MSNVNRREQRAARGNLECETIYGDTARWEEDQIKEKLQIGVHWSEMPPGQYAESPHHPSSIFEVLSV